MNPASKPRATDKATSPVNCQPLDRASLRSGPFNAGWFGSATRLVVVRESSRAASGAAPRADG